MKRVGVACGGLLEPASPESAQSFEALQQALPTMIDKLVYFPYLGPLLNSGACLSYGVAGLYKRDINPYEALHWSVAWVLFHWLGRQAMNFKTCAVRSIEHLEYGGAGRYCGQV